MLISRVHDATIHLLTEILERLDLFFIVVDVHPPSDEKRTVEILISYPKCPTKDRGVGKEGVNMCQAAPKRRTRTTTPWVCVSGTKFKNRK